jgi:hypothetical protein
MLWFSSRGRHVGSGGFPQFTGREPTNRTITAEAVHIFRIVESRLAEHWAVRDDLGVLRQLDAPEPMAGLPTQERPVFSAPISD